MLVGGRPLPRTGPRQTKPGVDAVSTTTTTGRRHRSPREGPTLATLVTLLPDGRPAGAASPIRSAPLAPYGAQFGGRSGDSGCAVAGGGESALRR